MEGQTIRDWLKKRKLNAPWLVEQLSRRGKDVTTDTINVTLYTNGNPKLRNEIGLIIAEYDRIYGYANGTNPN